MKMHVPPYSTLHIGLTIHFHILNGQGPQPGPARDPYEIHTQPKPADCPNAF